MMGWMIMFNGNPLFETEFLNFDNIKNRDIVTSFIERNKCILYQVSTCLDVFYVLGKLSMNHLRDF